MWARITCGLQLEMLYWLSMTQHIKRFKLLLMAAGITLCTVGIKMLLHTVLHFEPIEQSSLHNGLVSSAIFVIGFLLSATIADYKESERIPAELAATVDDIYHDARQLHKTYPGFDMSMLRKSLLEILASFRAGTRANRKDARQEIADLQASFGQMETAGVPPNFVTKLKQQSSLLTRHLFRVNYIQRIHFIPSATLLVWLIVCAVVGILLLTNLTTFYAELLITGTITFIMIYLLLLIRVISVPFQAKGATRDDVSLFLLREVREYLEQEEANADQSAAPKRNKRRK